MDSGPYWQTCDCCPNSVSIAGAAAGQDAMRGAGSGNARGTALNHRSGHSAVGRVHTGSCRLPGPRGADGHRSDQLTKAYRRCSQEPEVSAAEARRLVPSPRTTSETEANNPVAVPQNECFMCSPSSFLPDRESDVSIESRALLTTPRTTRTKKARHRLPTGIAPVTPPTCLRHLSRGITGPSLSRYLWAQHPQ